MGQYVFKLPDLGEGTVEAEIGEWHIKPGDTVAEDDVIVDMMTDKAAVEIPSPVGGRVVSLHGEPGDVVAVGTDLIVFELEAETGVAEEGAIETDDEAAAGAAAAPELAQPAVQAKPHANRRTSDRILTSPAIRARAKEHSIDLHDVPGSGPRGRILASDLDAYIASGGKAPAPAQGAGTKETDETEEFKVIGVRRVIARKMSESKRNIPHFTYVEEIDVTELNALRQHLNANRDADQPSLTYLPLLIAALTRALERFPQCNATYDAEREVVVRHAAAHVGIATQTDDGLKVPVLRQAQAKSVWEMAEEILRLSEAARNNKARKDELTGSTITVTSLGPLGGIVTTPVINAPEVGIIGVNKAVDRPVVHAGQITVRKMMNLSASFDHRFVDGYDAAEMVQYIKGLVEHPATIFMP